MFARSFDDVQEERGGIRGTADPVENLHGPHLGSKAERAVQGLDLALDLFSRCVGSPLDDLKLGSVFRSRKPRQIFSAGII